MSYSLLNNEHLPEGIYLGMGSIDHSQEVLQVLEDEEIVEYESIKSDNRKNEFLSSRHLIRGLAAKFGLLENDFRIRKDDLGKPYGETGDKHFFLSIAHSAHYVLCGLSETMDIGIDLEPADRKVHKGLKSRIFHPEEKDDIRSLKLIQVWTLKEALVKLHGGGLRTNLNELRLQKMSESEYTTIFNDDKSARICSFKHNEHWVSVAYYQ